MTQCYYDMFFSLGANTITRPDENVFLNATEGEDVVLSCTARGLIRPVISWSPGPDMQHTINTNEITDNDGFQVVTSNLTIISIRRNETIYNCSVSDNESRSFALEINCKFI